MAPYIERSEVEISHKRFNPPYVDNSLMSTEVETSRKKLPPRTKVRGLQSKITCILQAKINLNRFPKRLLCKVEAREGYHFT